MKTDKPKCGFCFDREQGTHGEIKREWSDEWMMFISVCRKHASEQQAANEIARLIEECSPEDFFLLMVALSKQNQKAESENRNEMPKL